MADADAPRGKELGGIKEERRVPVGHLHEDHLHEDHLVPSAVKSHSFRILMHRRDTPTLLPLGPGERSRVAGSGAAFYSVGNLGYKNMSQDPPGNAEASGVPTVARCYNYANEVVGGKYILDADLEDDLYDVLDDEEETNGFPPNLSEFEAANMSIQPQITINKAQSDIFQQYKNEYRLIRQMISEENEAMGGDPRLRQWLHCYLAPRATSTACSRTT